MNITDAFGKMQPSGKLGARPRVRLPPPSAGWPRARSEGSEKPRVCRDGQSPSTAGAMTKRRRSMIKTARADFPKPDDAYTLKDLAVASSWVAWREEQPQNRDGT